MLIQCHSCNTKYRLNLDQIPRRKTFVRCKNCGTPIYIDPTEDEQPAVGVIPPPPGAVGPQFGDAQADLVQVDCPSCDARYRIAAATVRRPGVKLKCTQCGHLFAPPEAFRPPAPPTGVPVAAPGINGAASGGAVGPEAAAAPGPVPRAEMPLPDEAQMDQMFDDLRPEPVHRAPEAELPPEPAVPRETELGSLADEGFAFDEEAPVPDAEQAYLDSVAIDDDGSDMPTAGSVPDAQKYRFFLNPKDYQGSEPPMPDSPDETDILPPLEGEAPEAPQQAAASMDGLPPLDAAAEPPPPPTVQGAQSREEMQQVREVVPGQQARVFTEKRVLTIVAAGAVLILAATGAWGYWLAATAGNDRPYNVRVGQPHQLALENDLQGHYLTNGPSGQRLFVVTGEIENRFPPDSAVRWIRIKGTAYTDPDQSKALGTAFAYVGNVLDDSQLGQWELAAVKAYAGFTNGRKEANVGIAAGARVPFQLVFSGLNGKVGRTVAQVVSYHRNGRAVFIDNP